MPFAETKPDYHVVDPSPWPVVGALGVFIMMVGAVFWLNGGYAGFGVLAGIPWIFAIGFALAAFTAAGWWRDVVVESREGAHTPAVKLGFRYGMVLFLVAEAMFFAAWFWAWFHFALSSPAAGWPPPGVAVPDPWRVPLFATVIMLTSITTLSWAGHAINAADRTGTVLGLVVTAFLGAGFCAVTAWQLGHAGLPFGAASARGAAAIYGSLYYLATGLVAANVFAGTLFLLAATVRAVRGHFTPAGHFGFEAALWYWRFAVALWLFFAAAVTLLG